jgi:hypothetical protein
MGSLENLHYYQVVVEKNLGILREAHNEIVVENREIHQVIQFWLEKFLVVLKRIRSVPTTASKLHYDLYHFAYLAF